MDNLPFNLSKLKGKIIAIDGPAGAGKSTTAKILAARLGYSFLDTGAMYRALTLFALNNDIPVSDGEKLELLAQRIPIEFETHEDVNRVIYNGEDVTEGIRKPEVNRHVSEVAAHQGVRQAMVVKQKELGKDGSIVAEGRDTTTVVFPKADLKVYLDASVEQRAERRLLELVKKGVTTTLAEQMADIQRRDQYDSGRKHSPLTRARDAIVVDTTNLTIEGQVDKIIEIFRDTFK